MFVVKHLTHVCACLAWLTLIGVSGQAQASYGLSGQVLDVCGAWIPGARVALSDEAGVSFEALVDGTMRFSFPDVPGAGPWRLTADLTGFEQYVFEELVLEPGLDNEMTIRLVSERVTEFTSPHWPTPRPAYEVVGSVIAGGRVVQDATVTMRHETNGLEERCKSDELGRFAFRVMSSGPWRMRVEAAGFAPFSTAGLALAPRERRAVNVSLDRVP